MKTHFMLFLTIASLLCTSMVFGQKIKVKIKKDKTLVNNVPYCMTDCKGIMTEDCTIKTLDGKIIASLVLHEFKISEDLSEGIYEIIFLNTDYKIQMKKGINFAKKLMKKFYEYEVLKDGQLNEAGLQNLAKVYSKDLIAERNNTATNTTITTIKPSNYTLVERDHSKSISLIGNDIKQDFEEIGTYEDNTFSKDGESMVRYKFYLPNGTMVATATMNNFSKDGECKVVTLKDNEMTRLKLKGTFKTEFAKEIIQYLVDRYYL